MATPTTDTQLEADYIIVGGGLTGVALASLLSRPSETSPAATVIILEAGPSPSAEHDTISTYGGFALQGSDLDWQYTTVPVASTDSRKHVLTAGKTLGGSSILNYGGWSRGDAADYDGWATAAASLARRYDSDSNSNNNNNSVSNIDKNNGSTNSDWQRWNWANLQPALQRSERLLHNDNTIDDSTKSGGGAVLVTGVNSASHGRQRYPLSSPLRSAWTELGVKSIIEPSNGTSTGSTQGLAEWMETWIDGKRQPSQAAYPLQESMVSVVMDARVERVGFEVEQDQEGKVGRPAAKTVLTQRGDKVCARKEVILCAGTFGTPTVLQASGIGARSLVEELGVPMVKELPGVGAAYFDHFALFQLWKLKPSKHGLALGHEDFAGPEYTKGLPVDWVVNESLPRDVLEQALDADGVYGVERDALLQPGRSFVETSVFYHPLAPGVPVDGSFLCTSVMLTLPSSRGQVTAAKGAEPPVIDPAYFTTALDRAALVYGVERVLKLMLGTESMASFVEAEVPPPGLEALSLASGQDEIAARIRAAGSAHFHAMGSCPLGSVLYADLRVKETKGLRVCDASVFPAPVGGHPMATLYAVAETAAQIIRETKD